MWMCSLFSVSVLLWEFFCKGFFLKSILWVFPMNVLVCASVNGVLCVLWIIFCVLLWMMFCDCSLGMFFWKCSSVSVVLWVLSLNVLLEVFYEWSLRLCLSKCFCLNGVLRVFFANVLMGVFIYGCSVKEIWGMFSMNVFVHWLSEMFVREHFLEIFFYLVQEFFPILGCSICEHLGRVFPLWVSRANDAL